MGTTLRFVLAIGALSWALAEWLGYLADDTWEDAATWEKVPVAECAVAGLPRKQCSQAALVDAGAPEPVAPWWVKVRKWD